MKVNREVGEEVSDKTVVVLDVRGLENDYLLSGAWSRPLSPTQRAVRYIIQLGISVAGERRGLEDGIIIVSLSHIIHIHIQTA